MRYFTDDLYNHPGRLLTEQNAWARQVLQTTAGGRYLYLTGSGATPEGQFPFLRRLDLHTDQPETLWRCSAPFYEAVSSFQASTGRLLLRRESPDVPPNYFLRGLGEENERQLTRFEHPFPLFKEVKKELVQYRRKDGLPLSGTLYLPPGYRPEDHGPLPTLLWAYPKEYKKAAHAGQVTDSPYRFTWAYSLSPVLWVMRGFAVLDDPAMPIVGEEGEEPNDTFTEQLVAGAEAAVEHLVSLGIADPKRVAIGGHSYGAFMTAHLLTHSDLFAAGIARSGAYNRTLTPFGFQHEDRHYWQASDTYHRMSPFSDAHRMKTPLLLIHGQDDRNPGTHPLQSERYYAALKGLGAPVRLVMLPHEGHGYRARESVFHTVWETDVWLHRHLGEATYRVPTEGSLGLLALGFRGVAAWRDAQDKPKDEEQ
jgi:dipeptidyl aminopeptidase/acylaminoacyl peptidase